MLGNIYWWISILLHSNAWYNILSKFDFQDASIKVKVVVAIFKKKKKKKKQLCHRSGAYFYQLILI